MMNKLHLITFALSIILMISCQSDKCEINLLTASRYAIKKDVPIYYNGTQVGTIVKTFPLRDSTLAKAIIDSDVQIPHGSKFTITSKSVIGGSMVLIEPSNQINSYYCGDSVRVILDGPNVLDSLLREYIENNQVR